MNFDIIAPHTAAAPPAGGAELTQIVIATVAAVLITAVVLWIGLGHRSGRVAILARLARLAERLGRMPGWLGLPSTVGTASLLIALLGMYWDISLHIDNGRDPGPLANPAHYFILVGLFGIFIAGFVAMVLPKERPSTVAIRIGDDWWAPLGGVLICVCGAFSLIGFPLDDLWHRLFGQDVTLWGPTHLMLIGGAAMTLIGIAVLTIEGLRANASLERAEPERRWTILSRTVALSGGLLVGLSTFQAEFDFGVPQFRLVFQPMLIMLAAGIGLVVARIYGGRGAAIGAVAFFIVVRGALSLLVGPLLGETMPHFPLYVVEALGVELVALRVPPDRSLRFGLWCGAAIGTAGLAAEWLWSGLWMPISWSSSLFPEGAVFGLLAAFAGSVIGAWIGAHLSVEGGARRPPLRHAAIAAAVLLAAMVVFALRTPAERGASADVSLRKFDPAGGYVRASIRMHPADAADGAEWLNVTAWQGGKQLVVDPLERIGSGRYRTTEPIPVSGSWKTMVRLHEGDSLTALPIFLPRDSAIPVGEVPALPEFSRSFGDEHKLLQREQTGGGALLTAAAYSTVVGVTLALLVLLAWALRRLRLDGRRP
jgi:hypothetical protein